MRYSFCFTPVELGLEFLLSARISWVECEKKMKVKSIDIKELQFDGVPEEVVRKLNEKKMKRMDFLQIQLDMILGETKLYVVAKEEKLGVLQRLW